MGLAEHRHSLAVGAGDARDAMAEAFNQLLDIHGDQRFVLDDEDVGRHLARNLHRGIVEQVVERRRADVEDFGRLGFGEPFHGDEQERLARQGREARQIASGPLFPGKTRGRRRYRHRRRGEELGEQPVESDAVARCLGENRRIGNQCFEGCRHVGVAGCLRARSRARKPPQIRKMRGNPHRQSHELLPVTRSPESGDD